jgi:hypothetical protein
MYVYNRYLKRIIISRFFGCKYSFNPYFLGCRVLAFRKSNISLCKFAIYFILIFLQSKIPKSLKKKLALNNINYYAYNLSYSNISILNTFFLLFNVYSIYFTNILYSNFITHSIIVLNNTFSSLYVDYLNFIGLDVFNNFSLFLKFKDNFNLVFFFFYNILYLSILIISSCKL